MDTGEQPSSKEPKREDDGILQEILLLLKKYFFKDLPGTMSEDLVKISRLMGYFFTGQKLHVISVHNQNWRHLVMKNQEIFIVKLEVNTVEEMV